MIVPMKKVSLLVLDKNKEDAVQKFRDLGVIHLEKKTVSSPALTSLMNRHTQIEMVEGILNGFTPKKNSKVAPSQYKGDLVGRVLALTERRGKLQDYIFHHQREVRLLEKWGEFNPKDFEYLAKHGVNAYLYNISFDSYEKNTKDVPVITLSRDEKDHRVYLLAFDKIPNEEPWPLPERPLSIVEERDYIRKYELSEIDKVLTSLSFLKKQLIAEKKSNIQQIELETAMAGLEPVEPITENAENSAAPSTGISWISGYVPAPDMGSLKRAVSENSWALFAKDPDPEDTEVPTKLKNSKFAQLLSPVTDFLELVPGYREADITIWFLIFFTIFFGMIFGDAAYGTILFLIAIIGILKTAKKGVPLGFKFLLLMSVSNLIWGTLVGAWFALNPIQFQQVQVLQNLSLPLIVTVPDGTVEQVSAWLSAYNANNLWIQSGLVSPITDVQSMAGGVKTHLMLFCFSLALLQLGIAHIKNFIGYIRIGSLKLLSEIGRMGLLVGMYFVVLSLIVFGKGFGGVESWQLACIAIGWAMIFIFGSYEGSLGKSIKSSCSNIVIVILNITNVFSDIMSYIRLWAVGLAGAAIAGMINGAFGSTMGHLVIFIFGLMFFAVGHGFNMVLNVLAVLVHAVRLNILEFSSHVGINWTGFAYKPFKR